MQDSHLFSGPLEPRLRALKIVHSKVAGVDGSHRADSMVKSQITDAGTAWLASAVAHSPVMTVYSVVEQPSRLMRRWSRRSKVNKPDKSKP